MKIDGKLAGGRGLSKAMVLLGLPQTFRDFDHRTIYSNFSGDFP
jgi:hypothetical protein